MKQILIIFICASVMLCQYCYYAKQKSDLVAYYEDKIQWTIQDTSDELMTVCDEKIDEILSQF